MRQIVTWLTVLIPCSRCSFMFLSLSLGLGALGELLLLSTREAGSLVLDLLLLLGRGRVGLESDLLPFSGLGVGLVDRCHKAGQGISSRGLEELRGQLDSC